MGPIIGDYLETIHTTISASYVPNKENENNNLHQTLKTIIKILLHNNVRRDMAGQIIGTINQLGIDVLEHPIYHPDPTAFDYHIFGPLKESLQCRQFPSHENKNETGA